MSPRRILRVRPDDERGAVAVIVALLLIVMLGSAAMLFDLARLRHERHLIQAAVDLGSLAGAGYLPVSDVGSGNVAEDAARSVAVANAPQLASAGLSVSFGCVVSDPNNNGGDDSADLEFACGPAPGFSWVGGWQSRGGKALHACNPDAGDLCNTIILSAISTIDYFFAPVLGHNQGSTGAVRAAACRGFCGQASSPLDIVFVIDRTGSMSPEDIANLKDAIADTSTAEDSVLEFYDPSIQRVGFTALPYHQLSNTCAVNRTQVYPEPSTSRWQPVGPALSSGYRNADGSIRTSDPVVAGILCLQRAVGTITTTPAGSGHTDHGDPIASARSMLNTADAIPDVIVFFADGEANQPRFNQPCSYAWARADAAKAAGIKFFSLAYGASGARCQYDSSGQFRNAWATTFLARLASPAPDGSASTDDAPGSCSASENTDGDYYFCESRGEDLEDVFRLIAIQSIERTRLLNF